MIFPAPPSEVPSVVKDPSIKDNDGPRSLIFNFIQAGSTLPDWGTQVVYRDRRLRELWVQEPLLKSAIISTATRYAKMAYVLTGQFDRMNRIYSNILENVERQRGWVHMWTKIAIDYLTQDNGGFGEIIRLEDKPTSPCVSLRHLDAARCRRTGDPDYPVRYFDKNDKPHDLKYYQVFDITEAPSPIESMYGMQMCAVSRVLEAMQTIRDIRRYKSEKVGGRFNRSIHIISGVAQALIDDVLATQSSDADAAGQLHYLQAAIIASHQAAHPVSHEEIALASLPDGFDEDVNLRWYIIELALALLADPQDFAPLMHGSLGSSSQSEILAQKGRSKGPELFASNVTHIMNHRGILPRTVHFSYEAQDSASDTEKINNMWRASQMIVMLLGKPNPQNGKMEGGIITQEVAAQIARDLGILKPEYLELMGLTDVTPTPQGLLSGG